MKRKNGFTLIELLAVIVILAVIALIAVPQVIKILNKARLSAAEDTTYGITKAAESYVADFMLKNNGDIPSETLEFSCNNEGCTLTTELEGYELTNLNKIDFKGTKPDSGTVTISDSGKTVIATDLIINGFTCNYIYGKAGCIKEDDIVYFKDLTIAERTVYFNPETNSICKSSDYVEANSLNETKTGCMKWYKYSENPSTGTINMILDHNTTATVSGYSTAQTQVAIDTANWDNNLNARNIKADEIAGITGHPTFKLATATISDWFYFDGADGTDETWHTQVATIQRTSKYAWLFDYTENCKGAGCNVSDSSTRGYWTQDMITGSSHTAWFVFYGGCLDDLALSNSNVGVRPVITIQK